MWIVSGLLSLGGAKIAGVRIYLNLKTSETGNVKYACNISGPRSKYGKGQVHKEKKQKNEKKNN